MTSENHEPPRKGPGRPGVTAEQIFEAADSIWRKGEGLTPTIELVRTRLGSGSTGTVNRVMKKWRADRLGITTPKEFPAELVGAVLAYGESCQTEAIKNKQLLINALEQDCSSLTDSLEREEARSNELESALAESEVTRHEQVGRADQLVLELQRVREIEATLRAELGNADKAIAQVEAQRDQQTQSCLDLASRLTATERQRDAAIDESNQRQGEIIRLREQLNAIQNRVDDMYCGFPQSRANESNRG